MTLTFLIMLATAHFENVHFVVLAVCEHFGYYCCAGHQGSSHGQGFAITNGQHLIDGDLFTFVRSNLFYLDFVASGNAILLASGFYDCVHDEKPRRK